MKGDSKNISKAYYRNEGKYRGETLWMERFKQGVRTGERTVLKKGEYYLGQRAKRSPVQACYLVTNIQKRAEGCYSAGLDEAAPRSSVLLNTAPSSSVEYLHRLLSGYTGSLQTNTGSCHFSWLPNQK